MPIELSLTSAEMPSAEMTNDELQECARELRAALSEEGVTAELVTALAPAHTKGGEWEAIGQLVVKGLSIGGGGAALFNVLKTYLQRKPTLKVKITRKGGEAIEIEADDLSKKERGAVMEQLRQLLAEEDKQA